MDQSGRETHRATAVVPELPPAPPGTLVMNLTTGTISPTPADSIPDPGTTDHTDPSPPILNPGNPLTVVITAASIRAGTATIGSPERARATLLVLNVTIRNVQADPYDFRQSSIRVVDSENRALRSFPGKMPGEQELDDGLIAHDLSRSGTVAFEVPSEADRHYMMYIHDDRRQEALCITLFQATESS